LLYAQAVRAGLERAEQVEALLSALHALPQLPPEPGHVHSITEWAVDCFTPHAERMHYPLFRTQGIQVGSQMVEAACKTVVSQTLRHTLDTRGLRCALAAYNLLEGDFELLVMHTHHHTQMGHQAGNANTDASLAQHLPSGASRQA
jgi:hypothetical protein